MTTRLLALRWLALVSLSVWFGGFTFYSAIVIPALHDAMGGVEAGRVTGEVSNSLNAFGVGAVAAWWWLAAVERSTGDRRARRARVALLAATTAILLGLVALHPVMDARLESGSLRGFYPLHKVYLIASTFQWGLNLALPAVSLWIWRGETGRAGGQMWTDSPSP